MKRVVSALAGVLFVSGLVVAAPVRAERPPSDPAPLAAIAVSMPPAPDGLRVVGVGLDGAWAYAGLRPDSGGFRTLYRTPSDGSGAWEAVIDPATSAPLRYADTMPAVDNGVILADLPGTDCSHRLISGPSDYRTLTGCDVSLARGGAAVIAEPSRGHWTVEALDGTVLETSVGGENYPPVVADGVAVRRVGYGVASRRLGSRTNLTYQRLPESCQTGDVIDVRGENIQMYCYASDATALLRTDASLPPFPLQGYAWRLGSGFALRLRSGSAGETEVVVADLGAGHRTLRVAVVAAWSPTPDSGGSPSFVVGTGSSGVQVVALRGLAGPASASDDDVAPVIERFLSPTSLTRTIDPAVVNFAWTGRDPGHGSAVDFQVRTRMWKRGKTPPAWSAPRSTYGADYERVELPDGLNEVCLQVRGTDWAGNIGDWKGTCTLADGDAPEVTWKVPRGSFHEILGAPAPQPVRVSWTGADDDRVASYDLDYRLAHSGRPMGPWVSPPEWNALTTTSVSRVFPRGSTVCFRITATDRVGHTAVPELAPQARCETVPWDDRAFGLEGSSRRVRHSAALGGTATLLPGRHDGIVKRGVRVKHLYVRLAGWYEGEAPRVSVGPFRSRDVSGPGMPVTSVNRGRVTWYAYTFPRTMEGTLRIRPGVSYGSGPLVDAVWIAHR